MSIIHRRTLLQSLLASGGLLALEAPFGRGDEVARAIRTALRDVDRWHCAHPIFLAGCLGPWARGRQEGRQLLRVLESRACCCQYEVERLLDERVRGLVEPDPPDGEEDGLVASLESFLREWHGYHRALHRGTTVFPRGDTIAEIAFDIFEREPVPWLARWGFRCGLRALGHRIESQPVVFWELERLQPARSPARCEVPVAALARIARECRSGAARALARQALGDLSGCSVADLVAFSAAEEAGCLEQLPRRGPADPDLQRTIFRQSIEVHERPLAGAVGLALVRDRAAAPALLERLQRASFDRRGEIATVVSALAVLDYARHLPRLRRHLFAPIALPPRAHFACEGVHPVETWETLFPYDCEDMHRALEVLTAAELIRGARAGHACRVEAAVELAHRSAALARVGSTLMHGAGPQDLARFVRVIMRTDPRAAREAALPLLEHRAWEVRLVAAGAVLAAV